MKSNYYATKLYTVRTANALSIKEQFRTTANAANQSVNRYLITSKQNYIQITSINLNLLT